MAPEEGATCADSSDAAVPIAAKETAHSRAQSNTDSGPPSGTGLTNQAPPNDKVSPSRGPAQELLNDILERGLIPAADWNKLADATRHEFNRCPDSAALFSVLIQHKLLTPYQTECIEAGKTAELFLGNYRILDRLGSGGMGVVFRAEHIDLRRPAAIKVLPLSRQLDPRLAERFVREMRVLADLQHPNIVAVVDAGTLRGGEQRSAALRYFAMEYVPGSDLEESVKQSGPMAVTRACTLACQIAGALVEADKHCLVHRDIKPSNIRVTPAGQAKLLDFGLARYTTSKVTEPGTLLGSIDYIAPEQACDAGAVDIRADIYGLGGTLFWCLTGRTPFEAKEGILEQVASRLTQQPPSLRNHRPELPEELDHVIARMMATRPEDRYPSPRAVIHALQPFSRSEPARAPSVASLSGLFAVADSPGHDSASNAGPRLLLVTDDSQTIHACQGVVPSGTGQCDGVNDAECALETVRGRRVDVVVVDLDSVDQAAASLCRRLRRSSCGPNLKIALVSATLGADDLTQLLLDGADEVLMKPPKQAHWHARLRALLRRKENEDRSDWVNQNLVSVNHKLKQKLSNRDNDFIQARNAMVLGLARLVRYRENATDARLRRLERYCRCLADEAGRLPAFAERIDAAFIELLACCAPLHDVGKVGLPDYILMKPGKLEPDERIIMQSHTIIGADLLKAIAKQEGTSLAFLQMASEIARHHHERFDGEGYPDALKGPAIPLAARIVTIGDVYDALRSRRVYKPALPHGTAVQVMKAGAGTQFDPDLMTAFAVCSDHFADIFNEMAD